MRRKTLSVNASAVLISTILLAKLTVELVNKKKKVEEIYLELACTIGVLLLCLVATVLLIREKKEYNKVERSDSNLSLDSSDKEVKEGEGEKQQPLSSSVSCPEGLTDETIPAEEVIDEAKDIKSTMVKEGESKTDNYYNLTNQQLSVKNFGQDESIIAITLPESYSIKKYKKIDANRQEIIQNTKDGIIDDGDSYKPVNFNVNKIKIVNDKGKNEDSYQFIFKFQNVQKDDVFIEISCSTLNVYSGWKKNEEKPVAQYFNDLNMKAKEAQEEISKGAGIKRKELKKLEERAVKVNDDFLIFLDVKEILSESLKKVLGFLQRFCPANDQGLSSVEGKMVYEHFGVELLQKEQCINIKECYILVMTLSVNKKFPIKDILINDQLISKKQEIEQEYQNDVDQNMQVDEPNIQSEVVADGKIYNSPQLQNKEDETNLSNANSIPPSPSTSSGIGSDRTSIDDITITEQREEYVEEKEKKQSIRKSSSVSSSKSFLGSKESIDSTGEPKKKSSFKSKLEKLKSNTKELKQNVSQKLKKTKDKLTKKGEKTPPSPSISTSSVENAGGIGSPGFVQD